MPDSERSRSSDSANSPPDSSNRGKIEWDAGRYEDEYSYVWKFGAGVMELLNPQPGERILDVGCGTGQLTAAIARTGATVTGIDSSADMIAQAKLNFPAIPFVQRDARGFHFPEPFDAVFSNAALHWIKEPEPVIASVYEALKPGGRFVAEFGGRGNIRALVEAINAGLAKAGCPAGPERNPWYFPGIPEYGALLERAGLSLTFAALFDRPTPLEGGENGMRDWMEMFAGSFLAAAPPEARPAILTRIEERLRPTQFQDGSWHADYRRLRIVAINEARSPQLGGDGT